MGKDKQEQLAKDILDGTLTPKELKQVNDRLATILVKERLIKPLVIVLVVETGIWTYRKLRSRR